MSQVDQTIQDHPAPLRARVKVVPLFVGVALGPTSWIVQLVFSYGLASNTCDWARQLGQTLSPGTIFHEDLALIALNLCCLVAALSGAALSWTHWRKTRGEKTGDVHSALSIGEGRTRFISAIGVLSSLGFSLAILFNTAEPFIIPACWGGRP